MNETDKRIEDFEMDIMSEIVSEGMVKKDNIECCVCLNFHWGVKLPNCNHFICPKCYYKMYYGYVSDTFYTNHSRPNYLKKPSYPYENISENLEIYNTLTRDDDGYMNWFINDNEDLYNCIKNKSEIVENIDINVKKWFENEFLQKYENNLLEYELNSKKWNDKMEIYSNLLEKEKVNNINNKCPLCRL